MRGVGISRCVFVWFFLILFSFVLRGYVLLNRMSLFMVRL
jgi:hypothetical protein